MMKPIKNKRMQWIKGLMLFSQGLLVVFTVQWMYSQYHERQEALKKDLTKLFTDVQHGITDSLLLTNVIDPVTGARMFAANAAQAHITGASPVVLSPQGLHRVLSGAGSITHAEETKLFSMDTIVFNDMFVSQMRRNGWKFNARWVNNADSNMAGEKAIFIPSSFFTRENGVLVDDYRGYLLGQLGPQLFFVCVLLSLTGGAFLLAYKGLRAQIKLGAMKDDFISNMSHELKTPIATVKVALEALGSFNVIDDPARGREYVAMAIAEMGRLELLATRVLNTALLEEGKMYMQQEACDLQCVVRDALLGMQPRLQQAGAKVTMAAEGSGFTVHADRLHTQGVLVNLLDNSLKYGNGPVHIHISLQERNGAVQLAVADNGPGIPEEYKEKVFDKFFRVPADNRHNTKGYGLGLSYAAQVMRQHRGSIAVANAAAGGCVFTLTF